MEAKQDTNQSLIQSRLLQLKKAIKIKDARISIRATVKIIFMCRDIKHIRSSRKRMMSGLRNRWDPRQIDEQGGLW